MEQTKTILQILKLIEHHTFALYEEYTANVDLINLIETDLSTRDWPDDLKELFKSLLSVLYSLRQSERNDMKAFNNFLDQFPGFSGVNYSDKWHLGED